MIPEDLDVDAEGIHALHLPVRGVAVDGVVGGTKGAGFGGMGGGQVVVLSDVDVVDGVMGVAESGVAGKGCGVAGVAFVASAVVAGGIVGEQAVVLEGCATPGDRSS